MNIDKVTKDLDAMSDRKVDVALPSMELAETILDRVHLSLSKIDPEWQEHILTNETDEEVPELNALLRTHFEKVLKANQIFGTPQFYRGMTRYFYQLKADYLARYCSAKADYLTMKVKGIIKGKKDGK